MIILLLFLSSLAMAQSPGRPGLLLEESKLKSQFSELKKHKLSAHTAADLLSKTQSATDKKNLLNWYESEKKFQQNYDAFQNKKLSYMSDRVIQFGSCLKDQILKRPLSPKRVSDINVKWSALMNQARTYQRNVPLFGTKEDYLRVLSYNDLYRAQEAFAKSLEEAVAIDDSELAEQLEKIYEDILTLPQLARIIYAMNFQRNSGQGETPILDAIGEGVKAMGRMNDVTVTWQGLQHLPKPFYDGRTLNVIAFEHANSYLDTIAQAEIPKNRRNGLGFFGAAKYVFPESWVKSLDKSDHYIVVNQGKEIPRTMEIIQARKLHGFLAAAEGLTPAGLYETRPVSPLFTETYWELKDRGLEINLTPMSFPDNFRLYNAWKVKHKTFSTGVVSPSLSSLAADNLAALTGERSSVGIWIRSMWHSTLLNNHMLFLSSPGLIQLENMVKERLWGRLSKKIPASCF